MILNRSRKLTAKLGVKISDDINKSNILRIADSI